MKESKIYICELCGVAYRDKEKCLKCEQQHGIPVIIKSQTYLPQSRYPEYISVLMSDGSIREYKRV